MLTTVLSLVCFIDDGDATVKLVVCNECGDKRRVCSTSKA